jgi:hypothetical protein
MWSVSQVHWETGGIHVLQSIGGWITIVGPGHLENTGLFEPMCSRNVGLGLNAFS